MNLLADIRFDDDERIVTGDVTIAIMWVAFAVAILVMSLGVKYGTRLVRSKT